jgi:hypothetical protein
MVRNFILLVMFIDPEIKAKEYKQLIHFRYYELEGKEQSIGIYLLQFLYKSKLISIKDIEEFYKQTSIKENKINPMIDNIDTSGFTPNMLKELNTYINELKY